MPEGWLLPGVGGVAATARSRQDPAASQQARRRRAACPMALFAAAGKAAMDVGGVAIGGGAMQQAQDMFHKQQAQTKRYFAADFVRNFSTLPLHVWRGACVVLDRSPAGRARRPRCDARILTSVRLQAEGSWRHAEALSQAELQHQQTCVTGLRTSCAVASSCSKAILTCLDVHSCVLALAAYYQTERVHQREICQANLYDRRMYSLAHGSEIREALRDELSA
eukprot:COSAG01_NODE_7361_length_3236_cov_35.722346_1_plen_222_part_10